MWKLWLKNRILPNEYFDFELFNKDNPSDYIGLFKSKHIWDKYNTNKEIEPYINNKWKFYHKFLDLPIPHTTLLTAKNLVNQAEDIYQKNVFFKPVAGWGGKGGFVLPDTMTVSDIYSILLRVYSKGYVYQEALKPHPEIDKFTESGAIGALRVITLVREPDTIEIIGAFTKFVGKGNVVDYTSNPGNYLVSVDTHDWSLIHAQTNDGLNSKSYSSLNGHDIYGSKIPVGEGFDEEIYRWVSTLHNRLNLETSLIGWDIAVTNRGVYCLEANLKPGFASLQKAYDKGYRHVFDLKRFSRSDYVDSKSYSVQGLTTAWKVS